ncbi:TLR adapter interacting with SLC15A4 on the lysosome [Polypterus senegalus]|uniref:TLR adapter interacting with SLC15A4 on the lysosome n=1 Tax=Polypterus senegalus TaxID=55291 RepID=UPI001962B7F4|nr:TLR adapter interacting with SLC15A4 on the lysosome [Polypterus senegalus]
MLCESFLWTIAYRNHFDNESLTTIKQEENERVREMTAICNMAGTVPDMQDKTILDRCKNLGNTISSVKIKKQSKSVQDIPPKLPKAQQSIRQTSPVVDIPVISHSNKEAYLVPSSCKSICKDYNDLHIAGDQVMPINLTLSELSTDNTFEYTDGPFLQSYEIPIPATETPRPSLDYIKKPLKGDSSCWRVNSIKDKSILQDSLPMSNSMLNNYLEQKIMELYKQYMMESMLNSNSPAKIMASELILSNVDQITLQISKDQNMETTKAKDMVISCLLRVASSQQSSELSTPQLQISSDKSITS